MEQRTHQQASGREAARHPISRYAARMTRAAVLLYDGHCRLCSAGARRLLRWARPGAIELADFQDPGTLERFPELTLGQCMQALHLVTPDGRVFRAAEAVVVALATRGWRFEWARLYYLPGLRWAVDRGYDWVARNRYRLAGPADCTDAGCALHSRR